MTELPIQRFLDTLPELADLRRAVAAYFDRPATLSPAMRRSIEALAATLAGGEREIPSEPIPEVLQRYIDKVVRNSYKVTDGDFEAMKAAGLSEDSIYEATLGATTGASLARLERGLTLLEETGSE